MDSDLPSDANAKRPNGFGPRATRTARLIFGLACLASFLNYVHRYSWGVVRPFLKQEADLSSGAMGWLDAGFSLTYAFGQYPGGLAGDLFGPRFLIPIAAVLWSVVMIGPIFFNGFWRLMLVRLLFGATQAPAYPNLGKITRSWFPLSIRTTVQGSVASFSGRAGGACAPLLMGTVLMAGVGLSWQASLVALACGGFVFAIIFWLLFRNDPRDHPWVNTSEREWIQAGEVQFSQKEFARFNWSPANVRNLGLFMAASFFSTFADNLFVFYMPEFLVLEKNFSPAQMGVFASLPIIGGAVGGLFGGALNDYLIRVTGKRRLCRSLVACSGKLTAAALIAASLLFEDGRVIMLVLFCCKFFSDWSQPTWWGTVTDLGGPASGRVFGMVNMVGSIGGFTAGPVMGYVLGDQRWTALFLFVGGVYVVTAIFWIFVNCTRQLVAPE